MGKACGLPPGWLHARETRCLLSGHAGAIEVLVNGVREPRGIGLLCHPHPLFGGTLDNKVVFTLARALRDSGLVAVRFNFRGVGASEGAHDGGAGELADASTIVEQIALAAPRLPLVYGGFSFGAAIAARLAGSCACAAVILVAPPVPRYGLEAVHAIDVPVLLLQADDDEVVASHAVYEWWEDLDAPRKMLERFNGGGHFLHGQLPTMKAAVEEFLLLLAV